MNNIKANAETKVPVEEVLKLKECGLTYREIGSMFGVSKQWIHYIVKRNYSDNQICTLKEDTIYLLKNKLFESNLNVENYAAKLGLSVYMTRKILTKHYNKIRKAKLIKVAKYLNCDIRDLIEENNYTYNILSKETGNLENFYNVITYKNIKNNIIYSYKGQVVDGSVILSKKTIDRLKAYRISEGYSIKEFSKIVGLSIARISQLENGQCLKLKYSNLNKIASILNVNAEQLLIGDIGVDLKLDEVDIKIKINEKISKKIKQTRLSLDLLQSELGKRCGGDQSLISRIELGAVKTVKKSILKKICNELNLNYDDIIANQ